MTNNMKYIVLIFLMKNIKYIALFFLFSLIYLTVNSQIYSSLMIGQGGITDPTDILNLEIWLDGNDHDDDGDTDSGTAGNWIDRSSNGYTFTVNNTPNLDVTLNGLTVMDFDGSDEYFTSTELASVFKWTHDGTKFTMFAVALNEDTRTSALLGNNAGSVNSIGFATFFGDDGTNRTNSSFELSAAGSLGATASHTAYPSPFTQRDNTWSTDVFHQGTWELDFNNVTDADKSVMHVDGSGPFKGNTFSNTASTSNPTHVLQVGSRGDNGSDFFGQIAEIILYKRELTAQEITDVENYLNTKWGL